MFGGIVIKGDGIGKQLGFPTANLDLLIKDIKLASGVYAVKVVWDHKEYMGALVIQIEPEKIEVNLLDYEGPDFYGVYLEIEPIQKVAEMEKFTSRDELKAKIQIDIEKVRNIK